MALIEKKCSVCHKFSWDNEMGSYNETHVNPRTQQTESCNTNGDRYVDGELDNG